jgi:hypothetical protein
MTLDQLKTHLLNLENQLLLSETRASAQKLMSLLSSGFFEFGSSGSVYTYSEGDTFPCFPPHFRIEIKDFCVTPLAETSVLATYTCVKHDKKSGRSSRSLRSSVWHETDGIWKIVFHQGTPCA